MWSRPCGRGLNIDESLSDDTYNESATLVLK